MNIVIGGHYMYGVYCLNDVQKCSKNPIPLTDEEYSRQLSHAWKTWRCPRCGAEATWDDDSLCAA